MEKKTGNAPLSQHIFMFPFTIVSRAKKGSNYSQNDGASVPISETFEAVSRAGWKYKSFEPFESPENYNEFFYFHEYVRDGLFEGRSEAEIRNLFKEDQNPPQVVSYYFEREPGQDAQMVLHIRPRPWDQRAYGPYTLKVDHLSLRLFESGVAIATIELLNESYGDLEDVLCINDFGRRLYPQYIGNDSDPLESPKKSFFPDRVQFSCNDFSWDETLSIEMDGVREVQIAGYMKKLIGEDIWERFKCVPAIDDRMFTICWFGNDSTSKKFSGIDNESGLPNWISSLDWYKFVFIDGLSAGCAPGEMQKRLARHCTYDRWGSWGTLYGISRYSLVCLSDRSPFACDVLRKHMESMYYQIAGLLLAQRVTVIRFWHRVTLISSQIEEFVKTESRNARGIADVGNRFENIVGEVKKLHSAYIRFVDRLWFDEVTPQEQGIEMYSAAMKAMGLREQVAELKQEIGELHEFVRLEYSRYKDEEDRRTNSNLGRINVAVSKFVPPTLAATIWAGLISRPPVDGWDISFQIVILFFLIMMSILAVEHIRK